MNVADLIQRLRAATMRTDWNNLPDDACIPAVPLLREAADTLAAKDTALAERDAQVERLGTELARHRDLAGFEHTKLVDYRLAAEDRAEAAEATLAEMRVELDRVLKEAAVAAYSEPFYLGPEGMNPGPDGLLPPGSPYDRGRYDARKAVEVLAARALGRTSLKDGEAGE